MTWRGKKNSQKSGYLSSADVGFSSYYKYVQKLKGSMLIMCKQMQMFNREMETIKQNQVKILELKRAVTNEKFTR